MALVLEFLGQHEHLAVRVGELLVPDLLQPVAPVGDADGDDAPRHRVPGLADRADVLRDVRPALQLLAQWLGHVTDVHQGLGMQVGAVAPQGDDVWARAALDRGRRLRRQVGLVDKLEADLDAFLFRVLLGLFPEDIVHGRQRV
jgi:hypothetical protein